MRTTIKLTTPMADTSYHRPLAELTAGLIALQPPPRDTGRLTHIIRCPASNERELLTRATLSITEGLPGDKWSQAPSPQPDAQLAVMQHDVAELIANGQPLTLFGDNLIVDLDLSVANLPAGSRLRVGEAVVEVTSEPHNGCRKFSERFGRDALQFVNAKPTRHLNLRGIYWRVIEAGEVQIGSPVVVLSRSVLNHGALPPTL